MSVILNFWNGEYCSEICWGILYLLKQFLVVDQVLQFQIACRSLDTRGCDAVSSVLPVWSFLQNFLTIVGIYFLQLLTTVYVDQLWESRAGLTHCSDTFLYLVNIYNPMNMKFWMIGHLLSV